MPHIAFLSSPGSSGAASNIVDTAPIASRLPLALFRAGFFARRFPSPLPTELAQNAFQLAA
jgi:hypothetical protein